MTICYHIRPARPADIPALRAMQARSLRALGGAFYAPRTVAALLDRVGTMDDAVVAEGHYFVAETSVGLAGSGGWSQLTPGYAAAAGEAGANSVGDRATIRSVFVDPAFARRGIASAIMARAEATAARCGIRTLELTATLSGVPLYARLGYRAEAEAAIRVGDLDFPVVKMTKRLARRQPRAA